MVAGVDVLSLRLLGPFGAFDAKHSRPLAITCRRARALLAYLAMHADRPIDREELSDLLWDVRQGRDTRHNLRQCLVDLRKVLDPFPGLLTIERGGVIFSSAGCQVDAIAFSNAVESGNVDLANRLLQGDFLKGLDITAEAFGAWVNEERARMSSLAERLYQQIVRSSLMSGDGKKAIAAAEKLVALDPLHENWQRLLMQAYARFRGRHAAIMQARKFVETLKRELGVMPERETLALLTQIKSGETSVLSEIENAPALAS